MPPAILIIEPRPEIAAALEDVVASANYRPIVRPYIDNLEALGVTPAAIIVRVSFDAIGARPHAGLERLRVRPPVLAIVWEEAEAAEARRLGCEVILRAPDEVNRLCTSLARLVHT